MLITPGDSIEDILKNTLHELQRGALDPKHPFRYLTFGTFSSGKIGLRYVVYRKLDDQSNIHIYTDSRSEKIRDLNSHPFASILFYHPGKKAQVRLEGECELHNNNNLTQSSWKSVNEAGRKAYGSIMPPGEQILYPDMAHDWPVEITEEYFTVIVFKPTNMEVLQLNNSEHFRIRYVKAGEEWRGNWLVP